MLSINMDLVWTIINLIILYVLLKKFLIKPVTSIMEQRKALIEGSLANARKQEEESTELKRRYEEALKDADGEAARILEKARDDAKAQSERMMKEADAQARKVLENAREAAQKEHEMALAGARTEIGELAVQAAKKLLSDGDAGADSRLYDSFIGRTGEEK